MKINLIKSENEKSIICEHILRSLPEWFGIENAIIDYIKAVKSMDTWVAYNLDNPIGFISIHKHNEFTAEVHVMGVIKDYHRKKVGQKLLEIAEKQLSHEGFKYLQVKTLSASNKDTAYEKTRNFYLRSGFTPVEEFKTLWNEDSPCLLLIKNLSYGTQLSHIEISVSDYSKSLQFYDSILLPLGWQRLVCQKTHTAYSDGFMKIIFCPVDERFLKDGFHRKRIGLNHLAFYVKTKKNVDMFFQNILKQLDIPCLYSGIPEGNEDYYSVLFEDPDRIKLEVVFAPRYCHPNDWTNQLTDDFSPHEISKRVNDV